MTDETSNDQMSKKVRMDDDWADLQRDLDALGEHVKSLRDHASTLGETALSTLELRFQDVLSRAHGFRNTAQAELDELHKSTVTQAAQTQDTLAETSKKSAEMAKDTARQLWERAEPLRQGAQEVGQGLVRAWSEVASSFGRAAEKMHSEKSKTSTAEDGPKPS